MHFGSIFSDQADCKRNSSGRAFHLLLRNEQKTQKDGFPGIRSQAVGQGRLYYFLGEATSRGENESRMRWELLF